MREIFINIGIDIGGTKISYALINYKGKIQGKVTKIETPKTAKEIEQEYSIPIINKSISSSIKIIKFPSIAPNINDPALPIKIKAGL